MPLRLAGRRSDQNRSSRNSSHSESASQQAPHCRGRHSRNCDSFSRTIESSGKIPSQRSSGKQRQSLRPIGRFVEHLDRTAPRQLLGIVDLAEVKHLLLNDPPAGDALVFDDAEVAMPLAVLLANSSAAKTWWRGIVHRSPARKIALVGTTAIFARSSASRTSNINRLRDHKTAKIIGAAANRLTADSRARAAVHWAGEEALELSDRADDPGERVSIGTMHLAKGLEFKAVAVMACDEDALPLRSRIDAAMDEAELEDVYDTRTATPLRRRHSRPRSAACHRREAGVGVPKCPFRKLLSPVSRL